MPNTALNRTIALVLTNKSGGSVVQGDVVIVGSATASSFVTNSTLALVTDVIGVVIEPNGIANNYDGLIAIQGYVPKINLSSSASLGDTFHLDSVAKQAVPHSDRRSSDFGQVLTTGSTPRAYLFGQNKIPSYAKLSDVKSAGTNGGTFTSGSWQTRTLNTEDTDDDGIVSLSSNQFTLQAGTYRICASTPAYYIAAHKAKLYNITAAVDVILGTTEMSYTDGSITTRSMVVGQFTISSASVFEIQHRCEITRATDGLGYRSNFGVAEVYTVVELWKLY